MSKIREIRIKVSQEEFDIIEHLRKTHGMKNRAEFVHRCTTEHFITLGRVAEMKKQDNTAP